MAFAICGGGDHENHEDGRVQHGGTTAGREVGRAEETERCHPESVERGNRNRALIAIGRTLRPRWSFMGRSRRSTCRHDGLASSYRSDKKRQMQKVKNRETRKMDNINSLETDMKKPASSKLDDTS